MKYLHIVIISLFVFSAFGKSLFTGSENEAHGVAFPGGELESPAYSNPCYGQSDGFIPLPFQGKVNTTYYLRAYKGSCWSGSLSYTPTSPVPPPPVSTITTLGCDVLKLRCNPSDATWYWQTSDSGTSRSDPSTSSFQVKANTTYYLRAYNGTYWSESLSYTTPSSPLPAQPAPTITALGCEVLYLTSSPSDANWYWQMADYGTSPGNPSTRSFEAKANTTYYLRAYNGSCWSSAQSYTTPPVPSPPVSTISSTGCEVLTLTSSPTDATWYWQMSDHGTSTGEPSKQTIEARANTTYYLRAYNGSCWSSAQSYTTPSSPLPAQPAPTITALGCEVLYLTSSPTDATWYWQMADYGTSPGNPSTRSFEAKANTTYYLRAYNGSCWSSAQSYTTPPVPSPPVSTISSTGCEVLTLTSSPTDATWYWQMSDHGTSTGEPSKQTIEARANTTYYLRAYNGSCWSSAQSYTTPASPLPSPPVSTITALGCEVLTLTSSPTDANWYWQMSDHGTSTGSPSTRPFEARANMTYYLRAYNGSCWSSAQSYTTPPVPSPPVSTISSTGCEVLTLTSTPSNATWYWQTSGSGISTDNPSTLAYSVTANTTYYLRAYNGSCWSSALSYTSSSSLPPQPVSTITSTGCESLTLTSSPTNANWYWQTSASGISTDNPSTLAYSVTANTTYYLRSYNGSCWSSALSYLVASSLPSPPVSTITSTGCESLTLTSTPSNATWYWQTSGSGISTDNPSTLAYSVTANTTYYLRSYNGSCWSNALSYPVESQIPPPPVSTLTTVGCESLTLTSSPTNANWYWQTSGSGISTDNPSTLAYSVTANTTYYLRAYNGSCWSSSLSYPVESQIPSPPVSTLTTLGCESLTLTSTPTNATWYWQTSGSGISTDNPSTTAYSVTSNTTYYLRAYNGSCWSNALSYPVESQIPSPPVSTLATLGCESLTLTSSPTNATWYWQTSGSGISTDNPSTLAYSVTANTTYYLRSYNGSCWSSALSYLVSSSLPPPPVSTITTLGCESLTLTSSPTNANWYWQTSGSGISTDNPSTLAYSVTANTTYYLRSYNGSCWSSALSYPVESQIPSQPATTITLTGCESLTLTSTPTNANWYWQTSGSGISTDNPSTLAYSVTANTTYYLRSYNGSCWSSALSYTSSSSLPSPPVSTLTTLGCESLTLTSSPSNANWYWQTSGSGISTDNPSTLAYSVNANATYYLRAYNGSCWSSALSYPVESQIPSQPATTITLTGCESLTLTSTPTNANWYWQTSGSGISTDNPSTLAYSVTANTTYYLRSYNGSCWSSALSYTSSSSLPSPPVSTLTTLGCESLTLTSSPSNANWYWQTSGSGISTDNPSTLAYSVNANATYYLRAYNGSCWSSALSYPVESQIPPQPSATITTLGCESLTLTSTPTNANWYWQTSAGGISTDNPSTVSYSVTSNTTYYLRAYNGSCWSSALSYTTPASSLPSPPVSTITTLGCDVLTLTSTPTNASWYWQTSASGISTYNPSTLAYSVEANTTYYLRSYNGTCWSSALSYTSSSPLPAQPSSTITTLGCDVLTLTSSPTNATWYWQTSGSGTSTGNPSTLAYSVEANTTYYLRAYNGSCWSSALSYLVESQIPSPPVSTITPTGCESLILTSTPSDANWYWQTSGSGTSTGNPSTLAYSVTPNTTYYLRAYNGSCWSSTLSYTTPASSLPAQPSATITTLGCESLTLTSTPTNANWYWQTSGSGTSTGNPSTLAYSVEANTTYYLRASNGSCWSSSLSYTTPASSLPPQPVSMITTTGCESLTLTSTPTNANWYWQTSGSGTSTGNPSTLAYSVEANTTYYLRASNGSCWSSALSYTTPALSLPSPPVSTITTSGCEALSLTCSPSHATWYWQTSSGGISTSYSSTTAFSVSANTTYYLRAYNGNCWSEGMSYQPAARRPAQPSTTISEHGGCNRNLVLSSSPSHADWYWQTSSNGTIIEQSRRSTTGFTITASGTYYLRAYNAATQCWSTAIAKTATVSTRSGPERAQLAGYEFCGSNNGKVELLQSQTGLTYQLMAARGSIGGSLAGTGSALQWTGLSADSYWVEASYPDEPRCATDMRNRVWVEAIADATADFDAKPLICATKFTPVSNLGLGTALSYNWEFGDTKTSNHRSPVHAYSSDGTYTVTMTIGYYVDCSGRATVNCPCGQKLSKQVTKPITTTSLPESESFETKTYTYQIPVYEKVLTSSANTFHSAWPHRNAVDTKSAYTIGEDGIWRTSGSYVFKADRSQSAEVSPATDGTYTLQQFNWDAPETSLQWLKTEEVVAYSPFSKPVMVEDVLQVPSSALYDYGGYLQSAQGVNMKNKEMAFTGFEYMNEYKGENTTGRESGNWNFGLSPVSGSNCYDAQGEGNYILIEAPLKKFENVNGIHILVSYRLLGTVMLGDVSSRFVYRKIECKQASEDKKNTHLVVKLPVCGDYAWKGWGCIPETVESSATPSFSTRAHTGKSSLMIAENKTFPQEILRLDSGQSYSLSAWVSSESTTTSTGIDVLFKNKNQLEIARFSCLSEGPVIERWQQIKGTFTCPKNDMKISLIFKNGGGTAYYDDLRLHPSQGNMESYVYDVKNYKLLAKLDAENFATLYYYDKEGQLRLTKKETIDGVKTLSETVDYVKVKN